ncbi:quinolinate synthase NadA [candidate division KSB1 bacterium]
MSFEVETLEQIKTAEQQGILERIRQVRKELGDRVLILGHHYQRDEVFQFADRTGDSYGLSKFAAEKSKSDYIVFCGVHFMAETADILTPPERAVILPDLKAGCSMADMANQDQLYDCWEDLFGYTDETIIPVTYVNSTATIKAFCGRHGGAVCTSANADKILEWAFTQGEKVLFLPDQHLGRNTAYKMGIPLDKMAVYEPRIPGGGASPEDYDRAKVILWQGYCSVHMNFQSRHVDLFREKYPGINILVHPECIFEVVQKADYVGSTSYIVKVIEEAPTGSKWAIGTEHHLVNRLKNNYPDKFVSTLSPFACQCATMYRISPEWLLNSLEGLKCGEVISQISVPGDIASDARIALNRMLEITG